MHISKETLKNTLLWTYIGMGWASLVVCPYLMVHYENPLWLFVIPLLAVPCWIAELRDGFSFS